ncbi:MAG TPA: hypothetical protein VK923_06940 [Euzebyales bacterium]|nr:hypothetical protein [Euzebyales bacterium]
MARAVRPLYTAVDEQAAKERLGEFLLLSSEASIRPGRTPTLDEPLAARLNTFALTFEGRIPRNRMTPPTLITPFVRRSPGACFRAAGRTRDSLDLLTDGAFRGHATGRR